MIAYYSSVSLSLTPPRDGPFDAAADMPRSEPCCRPLPHFFSQKAADSPLQPFFAPRRLSEIAGGEMRDNGNSPAGDAS